MALADVLPTIMGEESKVIHLMEFAHTHQQHTGGKRRKRALRHCSLVSDGAGCCGHGSFLRKKKKKVGNNSS